MKREDVKAPYMPVVTSILSNGFDTLIETTKAKDWKSILIAMLTHSSKDELPSVSNKFAYVSLDSDGSSDDSESKVKFCSLVSQQLPYLAAQ
jgi:hypothetical protein